MFAASALVRNSMWHDETRIWQDAVRKAPNKARPNYYLGIALNEQEETEKAFHYLARAQELDPDIISDWLVTSPAPGVRTPRSGEPAGTVGTMDAAHQMMLASANIETGEYDQAILILERVLAVDPAFTEAYLELAKIYNLRG
jgi:tetratricopeptide (TPR) repeat protein